MRSCCSSWSYHRSIAEGRLDGMRWLEVVAGLGLDGVELLGRHFSPEKAALRDVKKRCLDLGLLVAATSASNDFAHVDEARLRENIDEVRTWVEAAAFVGAPVVRIFAGSAKRLNEKTWPAVIDSVARCCEFASELGVTLALENHGGFEWADIDRILREVDSPYLALTLDTGNFHREVYESIHRAALHAGLVHFKTFEFDDCGNESTLDYERIGASLRGAGYRGFLSIEFEGKGDEFQEVERSTKLVKRIIARYGC